VAGRTNAFSIESPVLFPPSRGSSSRYCAGCEKVNGRRRGGGGRSRLSQMSHVMTNSFTVHVICPRNRLNHNACIINATQQSCFPPDDSGTSSICGFEVLSNKLSLSLSLSLSLLSLSLSLLSVSHSLPPPSLSLTRARASSLYISLASGSTADRREVYVAAGYLPAAEKSIRRDPVPIHSESQRARDERCAPIHSACQSANDDRMTILFKRRETH
jgi:hypothetical protein